MQRTNFTVHCVHVTNKVPLPLPLIICTVLHVCSSQSVRVRKCQTEDLFVFSSAAAVGTPARWQLLVAWMCSVIYDG